MPQKYVCHEVTSYSPDASMCKLALLRWFCRIPVAPPDLKSLYWTENSEFGGPTNHDRSHSQARFVTLTVTQTVSFLQLTIRSLARRNENHRENHKPQVSARQAGWHTLPGGGNRASSISLEPRTGIDRLLCRI